MRFLVLYYSGAGNTQCIAAKIGKMLAEQGHVVQSLRIKQDALDTAIDDFDVLILGFPTYFRSAPQLAHDYLSRMNGRNRSALFFTTKGMYSGNGMRKIISLAARQGFIPKGFHEFYMPGSDGLLLFAGKDSTIERFLKFIHSRRIDLKIKRLLKRLQRDGAMALPRKKWYTFIDEGIVKKAEIRATDHYRIFVGRFHSMKERCTECHLCVRQCPRRNIEATESGIAFGDNCDTCFRCIDHCPTEAIQIGDKTLHTTRYRPTTCDF
jgi:Pyruvate/2-oxoacid:ferredoxin oxidoreductase delta subunit